MTKRERIKNFVRELADLCERYDVEIATESMCNWSPACKEDTSYHAVIPTFATPEQIRETKIYFGDESRFSALTKATGARASTHKSMKSKSDSTETVGAVDPSVSCSACCEIVTESLKMELWKVGVSFMVYSL